MSLLELTNVVERHTEERTGRSVEAVRVHNLSVEPGEILSLVGPNGAGKSTLLEVMAFVRRPTEGCVRLDGVDVWKEGRGLWARRRTPMLLQRTLLFSGSVMSNVLYGLRVRNIGRAASRRRAAEALRLVDMLSLAHRAHFELSTGERQRVALARLLALESDILILDEPTASLDRRSERLIENIIRTVNRDIGATVIMASHNLRQALALSTRLITLIDGKVIPANLDNLFFGTMRRIDTGFQFQESRGWTCTLAPALLVQDSWEKIGPREGPVTVGIPSAAVTLHAPERAKAEDWIGTIDSLRQDDRGCRVRVRLSPAVSLYAQVPSDAARQIPLALGARVAVTIANSSVHVLPSDSRGAPAALPSTT